MSMDEHTTEIEPSEGQRDTRAWKAFELRKSGATYDKIAAAVGYKNGSTAESAVRRVMKQAYAGDAEDLLEMELARLDAMQLILWPKVRDGNLHAIDRVLKIMQQRQQYVPALAPKSGPQTNVNVAAGGVTIQITGDEDEYTAGLRAAREQLEQAERERAERLGLQAPEIVDAEVVDDEEFE